MASNASNRQLAARTAAVLTNAEVASTRLDLNECWGSKCELQVAFTLGMLTNGIFRVYVSMDGSTWVPHHGPTGAAVTQTLTANGTLSIPIEAVGWKYVRASAEGTGTVTSSTSTLTWRYLRRASQG